MSSAREPEVVIRIDLRAAATGPDAVQAEAAGPDTLITVQRGVVSAEAHRTGDDTRFIDVGRVLVIDDTDTFAKHATIYQDLVAAPTVRRLLCLVVGGPVERAVTGPVPGEPVPAEPAIELPSAAGCTNVAVLWVGDPRGVGWRLGMLTTTRLAVGRPDDPDGTGELAELIDTLTGHQIFDRMFSAIAELSRSVAAPATLPTIRWSAFQPPPPTLVEAVVVRRDPPPTLRWGLIAALLAVGCALIALVPPWVVALAVWAVVLTAGVLIGSARPRRSRLSRDAVLVVAATTIGTATGAVAAASADPLSHLRIPPVAADAASAAFGTIALTVAALILRSDVRRARRAEGEVADRPPTEVKTQYRQGEELIAEFRANLAAACRTVSAGADDEEFLQLNAPEQLALLDGAPQLSRLIAYAPGAARETIMDAMADDVIGNAIAGNDVEWTASGDRIGIIRLVPVRLGMLRTSQLPAAPDNTVITINVTGGRDHAEDRLAAWLRDDELDTYVVAADDGPMTVQLRDVIAARALTRGTVEWLHGQAEKTAVTFARPDGAAQTLTAAEAKTATEDEVDDLAASIANWLDCP